MIPITNWLTIIYEGANLAKVIDRFNKVAETKRDFIFYGIQIGWLLIGITIMRQDESVVRCDAGGHP